ncbi:MAG: sulfatase [Acidobacteriota bacterium]|nr:sulfatase [Acidobacteriota bacterium]
MTGTRAGTRRAAWGALTIAAAALLAGCAAPGDPVLLITIDSLRQDEVHESREGQPVSPALAALARESLEFRRAVSPAPWTTPAMMSILTGMPSRAHGVDEHDRALAPEVELLAQRFQHAGYRTAAVVPAPTLRPEYGFSRGFEEYQFQDFGHLMRSSPKLTSRVLHLLERWRDEPFFVWVHLWDPHYNYVPPPPWDAAFSRGDTPEREDVQCLKWVENPVSPEEAEYFKGQYEGEIGYTDSHLAQILNQLDRLALAERTIVAVTADHGEAFLEHGFLGHTNRLDEPVIHVPLLIRRPGRVAPGVVEQTVGTARLGRTLLRLAGIPHDHFGMAPALPLSPGAGEAGRRAAISETRRRGCFTSVTDGVHKAVVDHRSCRWRLFDVSADPGEEHDLAGADEMTLDALKAALGERLAAIDAEEIPHAALPQEIVEAAEEQLRSIGYVGGVSKDGTRNVVCADLPNVVGVDAFGDVLGAEPCPWTTARECLDRDMP